MDPVMLIEMALDAGATRGSGETGGSDVAAANEALRRAVSARFAGDSAALAAMDSFVTDPDRWRALLENCLVDTGAATDQSVIASAQRLMALVDADGAITGRYTVHLPEAQGAAGEGEPRTPFG